MMYPTKKATPVPVYAQDKVVCFTVPANTEVTEKNVKPRYSTVSKLAAEFLGCIIFTFVGSLSGLNTSSDNKTLRVALAHGFANFVLACAFGHISGGHFNPTVSLAVALGGKLHPLLLMPYFLAQLSGGFIGALLVRAVTTLDQYNLILGGATMPSDNPWWQSLITEAMLSMVLANTVLMCAADTDKNQLASLGIGFTVAMSALSGGSISGASMNPARSLGPALVATVFSTTKNATTLIWQEHFIYWAGPAIGSPIAALNYRLFFAQPECRLLP